MVSPDIYVCSILLLIIHHSFNIIDFIYLYCNGILALFVNFIEIIVILISIPWRCQMDLIIKNITISVLAKPLRFHFFPNHTSCKAGFICTHTRVSAPQTHAHMPACLCRSVFLRPMEHLSTLLALHPYNLRLGWLPMRITAQLSHCLLDIILSRHRIPVTGIHIISEFSHKVSTFLYFST
jgi:hypothetical protein